MSAKQIVLIAHAEGEEAIAKQIAAPLLDAGYQVSHAGTVVVGDSIIEEAARLLAANAPIVLCGTVKALGTGWVHRVVHAARGYHGVRIFPLQVEKDAYIQQVTFDAKVSLYWQDPNRAITEIVTALKKHFPLDSPDQPDLVALRDNLAQEYLRRVTATTKSMTLPMVSRRREPVHIDIEVLRIELPFSVRSEHPRERSLGRHEEAVKAKQRASTSLGRGALVACSIWERLTANSRIVVTGEAGCGKSTLLHLIANRYASFSEVEPAQVTIPTIVEQNAWIPIIIRCQDLEEQDVPPRLEDLLPHNLRALQFADDAVGKLRKWLMASIQEGRAILLVDGLEEIPGAKRAKLCSLLATIAGSFPDTPILATSRPEGLVEVWETLSSQFDHLEVQDLSKNIQSRGNREKFAGQLLEYLGCDSSDVERKKRQILQGYHKSFTSRVLPLALVLQIQVLDHIAPEQEVDVYRRYVELMIERRSASVKPKLSTNEVLPHLERLAFQMNQQDVQRLSETEVLKTFKLLRNSDFEEKDVRRRPPEDLLHACIESLALLKGDGGLIDDRGRERKLVRFFHQEFQDYFALQAIVHGRDGTSAAKTLTPLRDLLKQIEVVHREVTIRGSYTIVDEVISGQWQEAANKVFSTLQSIDTDSAMRMIIQDLRMPQTQARARAVFALQCLTQSPKIRTLTVNDVVNAAISQLTEADGFTIELKTSMDKALDAVARSPFREQLHDRLLSRFIDSRDDERIRIGRCAAFLLGDDNSKVTSDNADLMIAQAHHCFSSNQQKIRLGKALELVNRFFLTDGKLGFLTSPQQLQLLDAVFLGIRADEATECACMWALSWLTRARVRSRGPEGNLVPLDTSRIHEVEKLLQMRLTGDVVLDDTTLAAGCSVLTRQSGLQLVVHQLDWIYECAVIADGGKPRRDLPPPSPTGRVASVDWMKALMKGNRSDHVRGRIALALGAFGVYVPEMVIPLGFIFNQERYVLEERDEALLYLGLIGTPDATSILVKAADTPPPTKENDYLYSRGLFGLLLLDNVNVLAEQLRKAFPHSDLDAYAYGLAGSMNPRGIQLLHKLAKNRKVKVRAAVAKALNLPWMTGHH